ncbi:MAG: ubiquinol-cytochrome c reductase iron-sulfur subunit, partial [Trebonia sp.]
GAQPSTPAAAAGAPTGVSAGASGTPAGTALGSTSQIPVGGGVIFTAEKVAVTQPVKGEFRAFSAVCTHVGCLCNKVADGTIDCPCHGSKFKITDGAVVTGPAPTALPSRTISVAGDKITLLD